MLAAGVYDMFSVTVVGDVVHAAVVEPVRFNPVTCELDAQRLTLMPDAAVGIKFDIDWEYLAGLHSFLFPMRGDWKVWR